MRLRAPEALYLGTDNEPSDQTEVFRWLAKEIGVPPPRSEPGAAARRSQSNKRCRNSRLLQSGYSFYYPTFREGYAAILAELELRPT
jgi:hypothetical protein